MKEFNINSSINVKLTETGMAILRNRHNELQQKFPAVGEFKAPEVDENGYCSFQLWELMQVFGNYMYMGNNNLPFETTIAISDEYLVEQTNEKGRSL